MQANILDSIANHYNTLTRSSKKLADYILAHKSEAQYMSITTLAEASCVSEATITRFCKMLGLVGYNDFKLALAKVDSTATSVDPALESANEDGSSFDNLCRRLYQIDVSALSETLALTNEASAQKAISLLSRARKVYCFGQGGSNVMAMEAWARFSTASSSFIHIADSHLQATASALCTKDDAILFFSYSGATKDMLDVLKPAKSNGAAIILITHFSNSPAAMLADVSLLCGPNESPLQSGSIAAKIGQLFIIDYLFHGFCLQNPEICAGARTATAHATARKLL